MEGRPGQVMSLESELRFPSKVLKEQPSFKSASSEMEEKREKLRKRMSYQSYVQSAGEGDL